MSKSKAIIIYCTVPSEKIAEKVSQALLNKHLVACVNIVPQISSIYWWKDTLQHEHEKLLILKTLKDKFDEIRKMIFDIHPYDVPEIIAIPIILGNQEYLDWIEKNVQN